MTPSFRFGLAAYRAILRLYPADLRRAFASEMVDLFAYDLAAARGIQGALHLWCRTLRETFDIVLPEWWDTPEIAVPSLSAAVAMLANSPAMIFAKRGQGFPTPTPHDAFCVLAIVGFITALTSFIAINRWTRDALISLRLS